MLLVKVAEHLHHVRGIVGHDGKDLQSRISKADASEAIDINLLLDVKGLQAVRKLRGKILARVRLIELNEV